MEDPKSTFKANISTCHPDAHEARRQALENEALGVEGEAGRFNRFLVDKLQFEHDGAIGARAYKGYTEHREAFHESWIRELEAVKEDAVDAIKQDGAATRLVRELYRWRILNKWLVSIVVANVNQAANDEVSRIKLFKNLSRAKAVHDLDPAYPW